MALKLHEILQQPVIVENRPGANGTIGTSQVAKSPPDGYTLLMTSGAHTANEPLYASLPYDPLRDFIGITQLSGSDGMVFVVRPDFPANTFQEFVALVKANPGKFTYGHGGVGNATHVTPELMKAVVGLDILPIPYTGGGAVLAALLASTIDLSVSSATLITPYVNSGQVKALVLTGPSRSSVLPNVPTVHELGYPDAEFVGYFGLWFPRGTPRDRVERMHKAALQALASPELKRYFTEGGAPIVGSTPEQFAAFLETDLALQRSIAKRIGLKPIQ
jgi:tripartite-type tricarboxylate transporter receptor subunit TctC